MRTIIISEKPIRTNNKSTNVFVDVEPGSYTRIENPLDQKITDITIEDSENLEIKISFWDEDEKGHSSKNMYILKKDAAGKISLFDGIENLVDSSRKKEMEKTNAY